MARALSTSSLTGPARPIRAIDDEAPASLADRAYIRLRDQIITTEIWPGTLLRETELMRRLRAGRTPIREAIQRLRRDGFVSVIPRKGTIVTEINLMDLAAIYEVRAHLESWEAALAAQRATDGDLAHAVHLAQELRALTEADGFEAMLALDRRVHRFVYRISRNPFLAETIDQYHNLSLRILYVAMAQFPALTPRLQDVVHDQLKLLDAIVRRDGDAAYEIAAAHVVNFQAAFHRAIAESGTTHRLGFFSPAGGRHASNQSARRR